MALSASVLGGLIDNALSSQGASGYKRTTFSVAIAKGIVDSIKNKGFTTTDFGIVSGSGVGNGIGITGLNAESMVNRALSLMTSVGSNARGCLTAIMEAVVTHLGNSAQLTSIHSPVFQGVGTIDIGSIEVSQSEMKQNIYSSLVSDGANGANLNNFCEVLATAITEEILNCGTGTVQITGSGNPEGPGSGKGTGVIT